ncbi:MAG: hypothetical protein GY716_23735 [bacterium]|nr:hypothetical protein [bacterium]
MTHGSRSSRLALEDGLLLAAVCFLPWVFGGADQWAYRLASSLVWSGIAVTAWKHGWRYLRPERGALAWFVPAVLLAVWAAIQTVPMPPSVVAALSPEADRIYRQSLNGYPGPVPPDRIAQLEAEALERVPEAADSGLPEILPPENLAPFPASGPGWRSLSVSPSNTLERLFWYVTLLGAFLLARRRMSDDGRMRSYRMVLFALFAALPLFGLLQSLTWNGRMYWTWRVTSKASPFGPYVNPNHFAGAMELAVPWLVAYAWILSRRDGWRRPTPRLLAVLAAVLICLAGVVVGASRLGSVLVFGSAVAVALLAARTLRARLAVAGSAVALGAVAAVVLANTNLGERFQSLFVYAQGMRVDPTRLAVWTGARGILNDFWLTGSGIGTFQHVFPRYIPAGANQKWVTAHNDYLEVCLDGGVIAGVLLLALILAFWVAALRRLRGMDSLHRLGRCGILIGLAALSVHALAEFNHQMHANALLYVMLAAAAVPAVNSRRARHRGRGVRIAGHAVALAVVALFAYRGVEGSIAGLAKARAGEFEHLDQFENAATQLERAAVGADAFRVLRRLANLRIEIWAEQVDGVGAGRADTELLERARLELIRCIDLAPSSGQPWTSLSRVYDRWEQHIESKVSRDDALAGWDRLGYNGRVAIGMVRRAIGYAPNWYSYYDRLALTLMFYEIDDVALLAVADSARVLPLFHEHRYDEIKDIPIELVDAFIQGSESVLGQVPLVPLVNHHMDLSRLHRRRGFYDLAAQDLERAMALPGDKLMSAQLHFLMGLVRLDQGRFGDARDELALSIDHPVFRAQTHEVLARVAERSGDLEQAYELLSESRVVDPSNLSYSLRFAEVALRLERHPQAIESLRWAVMKHPGATQAHIRLVEAYHGAGESTRARAALERLERLGAPEHILERLRGLVEPGAE